MCFKFQTLGIQPSTFGRLTRRGCKSYLESLFDYLPQQYKKWRLRKGNRHKGVQMPTLRTGGRARASTWARTLDIDLAEGYTFLLRGEITFRIASSQLALSPAEREKL